MNERALSVLITAMVMRSHNLVAPRLPQGRQYLAEVNSFLAAERDGHAPAVVATAGTTAPA
jgi:hypothetical protein